LTAARDEDLAAFAGGLRQEILFEADTEGAESLRPEVLTRRGIEMLVELGEIEECVDCYLKQRGIEVAGYGVEDGDTLNLISTLHTGEVPPPSVTKTEISTAFKRLRAFWERCRDQALHESLEESSDAWSMALQIHESADSIRRVRMFLLTDGVAAIEYAEPEEVGGVELHRSIWDLKRMHRLESAGDRGEPIEIDFIARFGAPLACLPVGVPESDYSAYLAAFPGEWLAAIYDEFGARLLEKNVRSFLQFTGKVNRGMRDTIAGEDASRFFAYNNGISATASAVEMADGGGIAKLTDLQIVNGGQTTASIHRSRRNGVDIGSIAVQAKITEIEGDRLDGIVPLISQYANSQNRVSLADLSSNDPFHIEIESLSRSVWAPATGSTLRQTRWFYERARGQYADAANREPTPARRRQFREMHPRAQKITKTDLAKFENTWAQRPWEVSKGAQKNFTALMLELHRRGRMKPDVAYFQRLVAKAILFRRTERIVSDQNFGGYRANIVTYALAKLSHATQQRLNLNRIWEEQAVDEAIEGAITDLAKLAFDLLTSEDRPAQNVTEWAKRDACWKRMREIPWELPDAVREFLVELGPRSEVDDDGEPSAMEGALPEHDPLVARMSEIPGDAFLAIANWAKETSNLNGWERRFVYSIGVRLNRGSLLTPKQAPHAERIWETARSLGFDAMKAIDASGPERTDAG
jgi:hypothetical protein